MSLPYDIARCKGDNQKPCADCLRRTSPGRATWQVYTIPLVKNDECENYISPTFERDRKNG